MESSRFSRDHGDSELHLPEWHTNNARISRHNTMSRRFFPQDSTSFRSNFTISSTASSPGYYAFKDEIIDPSTYCFSTALKALQARSSGYHTWEGSSPEGLALNSKWSEAEKYICNPLSGKVPLECLSSKSLSARSFRNNSNRVAMSAPLVFSSNSTSSSKPLSSSSSTSTTHHHHHHLAMAQLPIPERKKEGRTRDVGTQSTPPYLSSSSPSPASTPSIMERSMKRVGESSSPVSNSKTKSEEDDEVEEEEEEEEVKEREETKREEKEEQVCRRRRQQQGGCFPWACMTTRFLRIHKTNNPRKYHNNNVFPTHPC